MINIYELHQKMTAHLFPAYSSTDERFLALAICGEAAELADEDSTRQDFSAGAADQLGASIENIRDEIADVRVYLELLAKCFGVEGHKLQFVADRTDDSDLTKQLCIECGMLANMIKKRWRDSVSLKEECIVSLMTIRSILEDIAIKYEIGGDKLDQRVEQKLLKVVEKHKARLTD